MNETRGAVTAVVIAVVIAVVSLGGCSSGSAVTSRPRDLGANVRPVRMVATPQYVRARCERTRAAAGACPRMLPFVGAEPAWEAQVCVRGQPGCLGANWDDVELQHADFGPARPPTWSHVAIFAGPLATAFPFRYPASGPATLLRNGLFARSRARPIFFGTTRWGGKTGTLVLGPGFPGGGEQGDHLIFRWSSHGVGYAIGLHGWEPLLRAAATLRAIVRSTA